MSHDQGLCCSACFNIPEIQEFIRAAEVLGDCRYCGREKVAVREVAEVGGFIEERLLNFYEDSADSLNFEGEYLFSVYDLPERHIPIFSKNRSGSGRIWPLLFGAHGCNPLWVLGLGEE